MLSTILFGIIFTLCSIIIIHAIADTILQYTTTEIEKALGYRRSYISTRMAVVVISWAVSGLFIFG